MQPRKGLVTGSGQAVLPLRFIHFAKVQPRIHDVAQ